MKVIRNRYILFEIISDENIELEEFKKAFLSKCILTLGELDFKKANVLILEEKFKNQGIIRCSHEYVDKIKLTLALIKDINSKNVILHSLRVSGTIKGLNR